MNQHACWEETGELGSCLELVKLNGDEEYMNPQSSGIFSLPGKEKLRLDLYLFCYFRAVSSHH